MRTERERIVFQFRASGRVQMEEGDLAAYGNRGREVVRPGLWRERIWRIAGDSRNRRYFCGGAQTKEARLSIADGE